MRCVQDGQYAYIFNAFSDGKFKYKNNNEGLTFAAMEEAGKTDPAIQARVEMFRHRVPQEFYDLQKDPGCLKNLIHDPSQQAVAKKYQDRLREWMIETHDHCLAAFDVRGNPAHLAKAVANYPKLDKSAGTATEAGEEPEAKPAVTDDKAVKRKANRTANKKAEAKDAK
jgi:N-sulfoglucosamine sulfohydrolase